MKKHLEPEAEYWGEGPHADGEDVEIRRTSARLRHFRGVAAGVMAEAQKLWREIWEDLQDHRSPHEILEGEVDSSPRVPGGNRNLLLEKLHLLGIQIDYAKRLCEGSIGNETHEQGAP